MTLGASRVVGYLLLAPESLLALCDAGRWQPTALPLPPSFQLTIAATLGRLKLPLSQVRGLRAGDVVMLEQAFLMCMAMAIYGLASIACMGALTMNQGQWA